MEFFWCDIWFSFHFCWPEHRVSCTWPMPFQVIPPKPCPHVQWRKVAIEKMVNPTFYEESLIRSMYTRYYSGFSEFIPCLHQEIPLTCRATMSWKLIQGFPTSCALPGPPVCSTRKSHLYKPSSPESQKVSDHWPWSWAALKIRGLKNSKVGNVPKIGKVKPSDLIGTNFLGSPSNPK